MAGIVIWMEGGEELKRSTIISGDTIHIRVGDVVAFSIDAHRHSVRRGALETWKRVATEILSVVRELEPAAAQAPETSTAAFRAGAEWRSTELQGASLTEEVSDQCGRVAAGEA